MIKFLLGSITVLALLAQPLEAKPTSTTRLSTSSRRSSGRAGSEDRTHQQERGGLEYIAMVDNW
jgi:hypothetical protein